MDAQGEKSTFLVTILHEIMNLMHVRHFWLAGVVLAAVLALLPFSFHAERHLETATRVEGSEAESVARELATRFRSPFVDRVVLVIQGLPPADSEEGEKALATIVDALKQEAIATCLRLKTCTELRAMQNKH